MSLRIEFVKKAREPNSNIKALAREFGVSRNTAYRWIRRAQKDGLENIKEKSRRPWRSPRRTQASIEALVCSTRRRFKAWGPRKIKRWLENKHHTEIPAPSTVGAILKRNGHILEEESQKHTAWKRFEREKPNELFQCDYKGWFMVGKQKCHPLTMLDDHSRYCVGLRACPDETGAIAKAHFIDIFRMHGLPESLTLDNGNPWGSQGGGITKFEIWLIRLGIRVTHSRPRHPQTQGKDERFHRSLKDEVLHWHQPSSLEEAQQLFDEWRRIYNHERPHEALDLETPSQRYIASVRPYSERLPAIEYDTGATLRKVGHKGEISFARKRYFISTGLHGEYVELREHGESRKMLVYFGSQKIKELDVGS